MDATPVYLLAHSKAIDVPSGSSTTKSEEVGLVDMMELIVKLLVRLFLHFQRCCRNIPLLLEVGGGVKYKPPLYCVS